MRDNPSEPEKSFLMSLSDNQTGICRKSFSTWAEPVSGEHGTLKKAYGIVF